MDKQQKEILLGGLVLVLVVVGFAFWKAYRPVAVYPTPIETPQESSTPHISETPYEYREPVYETYVNVAWKPDLTVDRESECQVYNGVRSCQLTHYVVGTILDGIYKNQVLYMYVEYVMGASFTHYVLVNGVETRLHDQNIGIAGIDNIPEVIPFSNFKGYTLKRGYVSSLFVDAKATRKVFTDPTLGDFYLSDDGDCLVVELPDHTAMAYDPDFPFLNEENGAVNITFDNGVINSEEYEFTRIMGCGSSCRYLDIRKESEIQPKSRLAPVGKTSNGESMYGIVNPNDKELKALYDNRGTVAYYSDTYADLPTSKYTYDQFLSYRPLLYWKDPLGRWVEFLNKRFIVAAEMCKPVIYLYPTKTTTMTVKVFPNGGFTFTEPVYGNGWNVEAQPDGTITDLRTGKQHEYLFWEGIGLNYPTGDEGWVVKREDVPAFIDEMLPRLGLQGRELADFKEYWVGRLAERPYYKLSFLKKEQFDKIAPLSISVKPTSVIRILMTAEGLDSFREIAPQVLEVPSARNGFTVVEWGGVVLK